MRRNMELDSLRGLAALSVLLYHALATNSDSFTAAIGLQDIDGTVAAPFAYTPLHVLWLGAEAVWLFFVLSGFVLTRSASRPGFNWNAYYPSRIVRLYVPVLFAIALAWSVYAVVGAIVEGPTATYSPQAMLRDVTLVGGTSTALGVLWSLQWEVLFSLALPLYLVLVRKYKVIATIVASVGCVLGWAWSDQVMSFLPMFFFGALLAQQWEWIEARMQFLARRTVLAHMLGALLTAAGILALTSFFLVGRWMGSIGVNPRVATLPIVLAGVCLLIVVCLTWPPLRALLNSRVLVFFGRISFSLYLVHLPIVVGLVALLGAGPLSTGIAIIVSLLLGYAFYLVVEKRAHALSRRISSRVKEVQLAEAGGELDVSDQGVRNPSGSR